MPKRPLSSLIAELQERANEDGYGTLVQVVKKGRAVHPDLMTRLNEIWQPGAEIEAHCRDIAGSEGTYTASERGEELAWRVPRQA